MGLAKEMVVTEVLIKPTSKISGRSENCGEEKIKKPKQKETLTEGESATFSDTDFGEE